MKIRYKIRKGIDSMININGSMLEVNAIPLKLSKLVKEYIQTSEKIKSVKTIRSIRYATEKFLYCFRNRLITEISTYDIERFKVRMLEHHKVNGLRNIMISIKAMFQYAVNLGYITINPARTAMRSLKRVPVARFLTPEEVHALLSQGCHFNEELKEIVLVALYTGMRQGEILNARWENVRDDYIEIPNTKTLIPRRVPIHKAIKSIFKRRGNGKIFSDWNEHRLGRAFRRARKRAGIGRVRFHDIRHTFCSTYLQSGGTIADLREISGHRSLESLQIYSHFQQSYLQERINALQYLPLAA